MIKIVLTLTLLFMPTTVLADISWMKGAESCESFAPALDAYLNKVDLSKYSEFPFWQKEELAIALKEACFGNFSKCELEACKKWGSLASFNVPNEGEVSSSLFWLNRFLTCEQLMEQIKGRYSNLSEAEIQDSIKQKEFRLVLSAACSDRFSHCSFASCEQFNQGKINKEQLTGLSGTGNEKRQSENYEALRANMIRQAQELEKENNLVWKRFTNSQEAEILSRRKEQARRGKSDLDNEQQQEQSSVRRRSSSSSRRSSRSYSSRPSNTVGSLSF